MATTTPNFGWPVPTSTDLVKDGATAIEALGDGIDASLVDLKGGLTGQVLAKTTNTDMDFTWVTTDDANAIQNAIVDAKGDLISATANDTPARLAVGNNGETLVADSSTSTGLRYQSGYNGNAIINGGFDIWQRGTSFTSQGILTAAFTADRWHFYRASGGFTDATLSRQSSGLTSIQYCARLQRNNGTSATQNINLRYTLESADSYRFAGQTVTASFYARKGADFSAASSNFTFALNSGTGTDQPVYSFTGSATVATTTVTLTTSWQRFTVTGTVSSSATEIGIESSFTPVGTAGANDYMEITGVQLELGSVATTFKRSNGSGGTIQGELAACKRYLPSVSPADAIGYAYGTDLALYSLPFDVQARVAPTGVTLIGTYQAYALNVGSTVTPAFNLGKVSGASVTAGFTITAGQGSRLQAQGTATILFTGCEL
jgi:hypothetical protein